MGLSSLFYGKYATLLRHIIRQRKFVEVVMVLLRKEYVKNLLIHTLQSISQANFPHNHLPRLLIEIYILLSFLKIFLFFRKSCFNVRNIVAYIYTAGETLSNQKHYHNLAGNNRNHAISRIIFLSLQFHSPSDI